MTPEILASILDVAESRGYRVAQATDTGVVLRESAASTEPPRKSRPRTLDEKLGIPNMPAPGEG